MTRAEYLNDQICRAERLARNIIDEPTVRQLNAFAAECRSELTALAWREMHAPPGAGDGEAGPDIEGRRRLLAWPVAPADGAMRRSN